MVLDAPHNRPPFLVWKTLLILLEMEVMSMEGVDLLNLIGNYAFPIVCCIALFWKMDKDETQHKEESDKFAEAVNNNTQVLTRLLDRFDGKQ